MESIIRGKTRITLLKGDITQENSDAIVNAANSSLMGGGGVDGAIHRAGGQSILEECRKIVKTSGRCAPGDAVITGGGNLRAGYVIHTVGPVWQGGERGEKRLLESCYEKCIKLAIEHKIKKISFPAISTGAYRYPLRDAAGTSLEKIISIADKKIDMEEIRFVLFDHSTFKVFEDTLKKLTEKTL